MEGIQRVVLVFDGTTERNSFGSLRYVLRDVVKPRDEVLVLIILNSVAEAEGGVVLSPYNGGCCCIGEDRFEHSLAAEDDDSCSKYLHDDIRQRRESYKQIFRPFYDRSKIIGVKFDVKVVAGLEYKGFIVEEANEFGATRIVIDRYFARDQNLQLSGLGCNMTLVGSGDGEIVEHKNIGHEHDSSSETSNTEQSSDPENILVLPPNHQSFGPRENREITDSTSTTGFREVNLVVRMPLQLAWSEVEEITGGFTKMTCIDNNENYKAYCGYLSDHHSQVMVKIFDGQFDSILKSEKKATLSMYHKNVLGLIGFHRSIKGTALVYPFTRRWTLDKFLYGLQGKQIKLTFQEKVKIAVGIGRGVRYMHEECPQGPIVHGDLTPCNIFLNFDFEPQITGFGKATWLQLKQGLPFSSKHFWDDDDDHSDVKLLTFVKSDILQYGILLLRLFTRSSAPQDDKLFLEWARPLLRERAYPKLLDEENECHDDVYGIYRVICVASQCINTRAVSRPSMTEVISLLKDESSYAMQFSPSSDSSSCMDLSVRSKLLSNPPSPSTLQWLQ